MTRRHPYVPARNRRLADEVYSTPGQAVLFTIRCYGNLSPFSDPALARIARACLLDQEAKSGCQVLVYCIMPDHVHVVVAATEGSESVLTFVDRFKGWCSRCLHQAGWSGPVWQPRSHDRVLRHDEAVEMVGAYLLHNPVRQGLVTDPDDYPWSGIVTQDEDERASEPRVGDPRAR